MSDETISYNSADEESVKTRKRKVLIKEKQNDLDLYNVMNTSAGRNVIGRILSIRSPFVLSHANDSNSTAFNEGMRWHSCLLIEELLRVCPELYMTLQMEIINKGKEDTNE